MSELRLAAPLRALVCCTVFAAVSGCGGGGGSDGGDVVNPPPPTGPSVTATSPANGATAVDSLTRLTVTVKLEGEAVDPTQADLTIACAGEPFARATLRNPTATTAGTSTTLDFGLAVLPYGGRTCTQKFRLGWSKGVYEPATAWTVSTAPVPATTKMAFDGYSTSIYTADPANYAATKIKVDRPLGVGASKFEWDGAIGLFIAYTSSGTIFAFHPDGKVALYTTTGFVVKPRNPASVAIAGDTVILEGGGAGVDDGESYVMLVKNGVGTKVTLPFDKTDDFTQGLGVSTNGTLYVVSRRGKVATVELASATPTASLRYDAQVTVNYVNMNTTSGEIEWSGYRRADGTDWYTYNRVTNVVTLHALSVIASEGSPISGQIIEHAGNKLVVSSLNLVVSSLSIVEYDGTTGEQKQTVPTVTSPVESCGGKLFSAKSYKLYTISNDLTSTTEIDDFTSAGEVTLSLVCSK